MKNYVAILLLSVLFVSFSCKKDKLVGDTAILIGSWKWNNTTNVMNYCQADSLWTYTVVDSTTNGYTYTIEFLEKGKVKFYHNDGLLFNQRLVIHETQVINEPPYTLSFEFYINNNSDDVMAGKVGASDLRLYDFPKDTDTDCEEFFNAFTKE
ncbi:hypothetical protein K6119_02485 [Paracrocinitomix mangrovi]|uniref:hypothetical protein n=1 Tax=Paracrocinitomix mangrovi TaxID=2862509 RepID=UPI001C8DE92D|nr:hypothetical protein [Paracrocinitomix mangrovi]UKN02388.1 hypothetical protein K6119_02485 [Paracrocinitomix mangrovi]